MNYIVSKPELKVVGTRTVRPDGVDKVTGRAQFGDDMLLPGCLCAKVTRSQLALERLSSIEPPTACKLRGFLADLKPEGVLVEGPGRGDVVGREA